MIKYFDLVLDLLNILLQPSYTLAAQAIEATPEKKVVCFHPYGFIFSAFSNLVKENITMEEYMQTGDISSLQPLPSSNDTDGILFLQALSYASDKQIKMSYADTIYIIDAQIGHWKDFDAFVMQKKLHWAGSQLFVC